MNIGVDLHVLDGIFQGSVTYLESIYAAAARDYPMHSFCFATGPNGRLTSEWHDRGKVVAFDGRSSVRRLLVSARRMARAQSLDVFHFQYVAPVASPCPIALTIHDLLPDTHPQYFTLPFRLSRRHLFRASARRAAVIFTVSQYTRSALQEHYGLTEDRIVLTPNGVDRAVFHDRDRHLSAERIQAEFGLSDFILTVGRLEPRKNHLTMLRALGLLKRQGRSVPRMVIIGQRDFRFRQIFDAIAELGLENDVVVLEKIGNGLLPHFYRAAKVFLYMSLAEGFGIPPLEAMSCGCPVIASNSTALPEVVGDAGLLLPPEAVEQLAHELDKLLGDSEAQARSSKAGIAQAERFNWSNSARNLMTALESLN